MLNADRQIGGLVGVALLSSVVIANSAGLPPATALALVALASEGAMLLRLRASED